MLREFPHLLHTRMRASLWSLSGCIAVTLVCGCGIKGPLKPASTSPSATPPVVLPDARGPQSEPPPPIAPRVTPGS